MEKIKSFTCKIPGESLEKMKKIQIFLIGREQKKFNLNEVQVFLIENFWGSLQGTNNIKSSKAPLIETLKERLEATESPEEGFLSTLEIKQLLGTPIMDKKLSDCLFSLGFAKKRVGNTRGWLGKPKI